MKSAAETRSVIEALARQHPNADTELHYRNAFELLAATILSAQATDAGVNKVTPAFFARFPGARALADAPACDVVAALRESRAEVLVCYLPVGSERAIRHYAEACLEAGAGLFQTFLVVRGVPRPADHGQDGQVGGGPSIR